MLKHKLAKIFRWSICASFLFISHAGLSISRVGNGSSLQSDSANFRVDIPYEFSRMNFFGNNSVRLIGAPAMQSSSLVLSGSGFSFFEPQFIEIRDFAEEYPELSLLDKSKVSKALAKNDFRQLASTTDKCYEVYVAETQSLHTMIVWIDIGKGYVLIGPITKTVELALDKIINSTQVIDGNCKWK
jgi:hypothetical protein